MPTYFRFLALLAFKIFAAEQVGPGDFPTAKLATEYTFINLKLNFNCSYHK